MDPIDYECIEKTNFWIEEDSEIEIGEALYEANCPETYVPPIIQDTTTNYGIETNVESGLEDVNLDLFSPETPSLNASTIHFYDPLAPNPLLFARK
ncbi:hypothetical protein M5689_013075 [Euphorbia peplus]|nr:hypothetical protein M5689_013075 [Euphorbia peplus]